MSRISKGEQRLQSVVFEADIALADLRMRNGQLREALEVADPENEALKLPVNTYSRAWKIHRLMQTIAEHAADVPKDVLNAYVDVAEHHIVKQAISDEHKAAIAAAQKKRWAKA